MLKKICKTALLTGVMTFAFSAGADARTFNEIYTDCGLGGMIFQNVRVAAVVSNIVWDFGTTAISSDITSPSSCMGGKAQTAAFIYRSYEALEADIAAGEGDYLDALAVLTGVEQKAAFAASLRRDFALYVNSDDFSKQTRLQKTSTLYDLVLKQDGVKVKEG